MAPRQSSNTESLLAGLVAIVCATFVAVVSSAMGWPALLLAGSLLLGVAILVKVEGPARVARLMVAVVGVIMLVWGLVGAVI